MREAAAQLEHERTAIVAPDEIGHVLREDAARQIARPIGVERPLLLDDACAWIGLVATGIDAFVVNLTAEYNRMASGELGARLDGIPERIDADVIPDNPVGGLAGSDGLSRRPAS